MEPITWATVAGLVGFVSSFFGGGKSKDAIILSNNKPMYDDYGNPIGAGSTGSVYDWINDADNGNDAGGEDYYNAQSMADTIAKQKAANKGGFWDILGSVSTAVGSVVGNKTNTTVGGISAQQQAAAAQAAAKAQAAETSTNGWYIIGAVLAAAAIAIVYLLKGKKPVRRY